MCALVAGCGFTVNSGTSIDASVADAVDGAADAMPDAMLDPALCMPRWFDGTLRFSPAVLLASVSSTVTDRDPFLSADERTILFSSSRDRTGPDVYIARRASVNDPFDTPSVVTALVSANVESKATFTADGLFVVFASDRSGGAGNTDLWEASRAAVGDSFGMPSRAHVMQLETGGNEYDPWISPDGRHLYFAPTGGGQHIAFAVRGSASANFGNPTTLQELTSGTGDGDPALSTDEKLIVFSSNRPGSGFAGGNLWFASRAAANGLFSLPMPVPDLNTDASDGDPHISSDGCRLYFGRSSSTTDWDIYVAAQR